MFIQDFKDFLKWWKDYSFRKKHALKLNLAVRLADMKQRAYNKRYFIILSQNNNLISINNNEVERLKRMRRYSEVQLKKISKSFKENVATRKKEGANEDEIYTLNFLNERILIGLRREKLLPKNLDTIKLKKTSFYYTPLSRNNDESMTTEERKEAKIRYMTYAKKYLK